MSTRQLSGEAPTGRARRRVAVALVVASGLGLGMTWGQPAEAETAPVAAAPAAPAEVCARGTVQGPPSDLSDGQPTCHVVPGRPIYVSLDALRWHTDFDWRIPADAHATFSVTRVARDAALEVGVNDPGIDGNWMNYTAPLRTSHLANSEQLFFELPARSKQRTVIGGFAVYDQSTVGMRIVPRLVYDGPAVPLTAGAPVTVGTKTPGQNRKLTFAGKAGQVVQVRTSNSTYPSPGGATWPPYGLELTSPGGSTTSLNGGPGTTSPVTLNAAGTYTLTLDPTMAGTGSVQVELLDVAP